MDQFLGRPGSPGRSTWPKATRRSCSGPGARGGAPPAQELGPNLIGTIHYEVVTSPRGRITRTYREAGKPLSLNETPQAARGTGPGSPGGARDDCGRHHRRNLGGPVDVPPAAPPPEDPLRRRGTSRSSNTTRKLGCDGVSTAWELAVREGRGRRTPRLTRGCSAHGFCLRHGRLPTFRRGRALSEEWGSQVRMVF